MIIRPYQNSDKASVIQLWTDCGLTTPHNDPNRDIDLKLAVNPEWFLIGEIDHEIVASCMAGYEGHRGWINYFHYGHGHMKLKAVKYYMEESLRHHLRYRHKVKNHGAAYKQFPRRYIYDYLGLFKVPTTPAWKSAHA